MKTTLLTCCIAPLLCAPLVEAGVNGTYTLKGTETDNGIKSAFSGTLTITKYKYGKFTLNGSTFKFSLSSSQLLKDNVTKQTVAWSSPYSTGKTTFRIVNGHYTMNFNYKGKGVNVTGSGTGYK